MALMKYNPAYLGTLEDSQNHYVQHQAKRQATLSSPKTHRKAAAETWTSLLRGVTTKKQRKILLGLMSDGIAPWFENVEMLMDFLTDSFAVGGSTALLALSGLFYLIQEKNLDYPQFYNKLYGLVDAYILHSKHRSRFLRLLDTFLLSTHLPAALVASFIKRLSRFCLHSAPAGLVVVIPWIYNLLKNHPNCTFMIHRKFNPETDTREDPFDENEPDPMKTGAIDSSLWEIETIQSHYQPSVAAIARVISEQFTKPRYNLEDFLDHSYGSVSE